MFSNYSLNDTGNEITKVYDTICQRWPIIHLASRLKYYSLGGFSNRNYVLAVPEVKTH